MQQILGTQLPAFSRQDQTNIKSGADFIGINHYTSFYAKDCIYSTCEKGPGVSNSEGCYLRTAFKDGIPIGETVCISVKFTANFFLVPGKLIKVSSDVSRLQWTGYMYILKECIKLWCISKTDIITHQCSSLRMVRKFVLICLLDRSEAYYDLFDVVWTTYPGYGELNNLNSSIKDFLNDYRRVEYMNSYLDSLALAIWY